MPADRLGQHDSQSSLFAEGTSVPGEVGRLAAGDADESVAGLAEEGCRVHASQTYVSFAELERRIREFYRLNGPRGVR